MHRRLLGATTAAASLLLLATTASPASSASPPADPYGGGHGGSGGLGGRVVATGLDNPRQLSFDRFGALYVAEAGAGGAGPCFDGPEGPTCFGRTGAVTRVGHHGQRRVLTGLPSLGGQGTGAQAVGPTDVAVRRNGRLVVSVGLAANPAQRDALPDAAELLGHVVTARGHGSWWTRVRPLADLAAFEAAENPVHDPDSNPVSVETIRGGYLVADAGGNTVLRVDRAGDVELVATFEDVMAEAPPFLGLPPGATIPMQFVPTSAEIGPDGAIYVSQLTGFPFPAGGSTIWRVVPGEAPTVYAEGLTTVTDFAFARDGSLYAVQLATGGLLAVPEGQPPTGSVVRVKPGGGAPKVVAENLSAPYGIALRGWDNRYAYVTTGSVLPDAGQVVRIRLRR